MHSIHLNKKLPGGYSGNNTKKALIRYGIVFDIRFVNLPMAEKVKLCMEKINQYQASKHYKSAIRAVVPEEKKGNGFEPKI